VKDERANPRSVEIIIETENIGFKKMMKENIGFIRINISFVPTSDQAEIKINIFRNLRSLPPRSQYNLLWPD